MVCLGKYVVRGVGVEDVSAEPGAVELRMGT